MGKRYVLCDRLMGGKWRELLSGEELSALADIGRALRNRKTELAIFDSTTRQCVQRICGKEKRADPVPGRD